MKKNNIILFILFFASVVVGCKRTIEERHTMYEPINPTNTDANAGDWKPVVLNAANEFPLAAPTPTNIAVYNRELTEIKGFQATLTAEQRASIQYWSAGGVLRWNEILRELVAKRNLPPVNNPDGSYPTPSAANPFGYPEFPFANPPYAARAYAYVSVAQYDALVAAFYYKRLYNRAAPHAIDANIKPLVPATNLPSYPSEDAVVAAVSVEMLKLLFPADIAYIQQKADQHMLSRIMAGMNTRSDIEAGVQLARQVAAKVIARAASDNMSRAIGTPTQWAELETQTAATGEIPWISQELPKRPPMLPFFGRVKPFLFDSLTTISLRPAAPPSTKSEKFRKELEEVRYYAKNATRQQIAIVHFWADGVGTYTPPGHWNAIAADDFVKQRFSEVRWARNLALLNMAGMDAAITCWDTKFAYFNPRPLQIDPSIKTQTGLPNFPAYTSGHSTFSAAAATILGHINPTRASAYFAMAKEASESRLFGGIHYRSDCEIGFSQGVKVGNFAITRAQSDGAN
ncbi:phosphatase PAP2 family protein [Sediminibacterium sp.]|uniref:phosphatase PAP2 family protein n=1 Tax=Sediminibacterium sp. TaxID=1917865 RepID=UPI003F6E62C2